MLLSPDFIPSNRNDHLSDKDLFLKKGYSLYHLYGDRDVDKEAPKSSRTSNDIDWARLKR
jgi:hypothetical protein